MNGHLIQSSPAHLSARTHRLIQTGIVFTLSAALVLWLLPQAYYTFRPDTFWHLIMGQYVLQTHHVPYTGIYSFAAGPYVPHEVGFEVIDAALYGVWGWLGVELMVLAASGALLAGMYRLVRLARREMGLAGFPVAVHLLIAVLFIVIERLYMFPRPQLLSTPLLLWGFIALRAFAQSPGFRRGWPLVLVSWALANVHAGVWPLFFGLIGIELIDALVGRRPSRSHVVLTLSVIATGLLNPSSWHSIGYFFLLNGDKAVLWMNEWQPIPFMVFKPLLLAVLGMAACIVLDRRRTLFHLLFGLVLLAFGMTSLKYFLFMLLFSLYYVPLPAVDYDAAHPRTAAALMALCLAGVALICGLRAPTISATNYPVSEMDWVLAHARQDARPKVLAPYNDGGYVMWRGADTFVDGRFDPFIFNPTGPHQLTPVEYAYYGYSGSTELLLEAIAQYRPDFLLFPNPPVDAAPAQIERSELDAELGPPNATGDYGAVWDLRDKASPTT